MLFRSVDDILPFVDWSPFFWAFELKGVYPRILEHKDYGKQAKNLFEDAQKILDVIRRKKIFKPRAVVGLWPANSNGDDVVIYQDDSRRFILETAHFLRQQDPTLPTTLSLSDFVAPKTSGLIDYFGGFVVSTGPEVEVYAKSFEQDKDDYSAIIVKAIGDRLAEGLAEMMHKKIRDQWGYGKKEKLSPEELIREEYRGIRPAPGYPACPDHTEKGLLWNLLSADENAGATLTENYAIYPPSSVAGWYIGHPESKYFTLGKIGIDQVKDYAQRKGLNVDSVEKWLSPNLDYDPGVR